MKQNIREKVLKEGDEKWDIFWKFNRDRIDEDGDKFVELDKSVISKVSFIVGFGKAIDLTLAEVGKVIDDFDECSTYVKKKLKQKLGIK